MTIAAADLVAFLEDFEAAQASQSFDAVEPLIHPDAIFRFNDGDHRGLGAIREAFETTWALDITDERYAMSNVDVIHGDAESATATFDWEWTGLGPDGPLQILGRGTCVVVLHEGALKVLVEHLS